MLIREGLATAWTRDGQHYYAGLEREAQNFNNMWAIGICQVNIAAYEGESFLSNSPFSSAKWTAQSSTTVPGAIGKVLKAGRLQPIMAHFLPCTVTTSAPQQSLRISFSQCPYHFQGASESP